MRFFFFIHAVIMKKKDTTEGEGKTDVDQILNQIISGIIETTYIVKNKKKKLDKI